MTFGFGARNPWNLVGDVCFGKFIAIEMSAEREEDDSREEEDGSWCGVIGDGRWRGMGVRCGCARVSREFCGFVSLEL